jgi:uncharacterized protein
MLTMGMMVGASDSSQRIYDYANLLTETEIEELENLALEHSGIREVDFLFLTTNDTDDKGVVTYMGEFFDQWADETSQENGVLFTIDMENRKVFLAGFGTGETYLDDERIEMVLDQITPHIVDGNYGEAFRDTVVTASEYMEYRPGVNPENILFKWWFQVAVSVILAAVIVGAMAYNSGGRVTTNTRTYFDQNHSRVNSKRDRFRNKTVSKRKKPSNNNKSGGGGGFGGGGTTGGGRSFSGGGRSF